MTGNLEKLRENLKDSRIALAEVESRCKSAKEEIDRLLAGRDFDTYKNMKVSELDVGSDIEDNRTLGTLVANYDDLIVEQFDKDAECASIENKLVKTAVSNYSITKAIGYMKGEGKSYKEIMTYVNKLDPTYFNGRSEFNIESDYDDAYTILDDDYEHVHPDETGSMYKALNERYVKDRKNQTLNQNLQYLSDQYVSDMYKDIAFHELSETQRKLDLVMGSGDVTDSRYALIDEECSPEALNNKLENLRDEIEFRTKEFNSLESIYSPNSGDYFPDGPNIPNKDNDYDK